MAVANTNLLELLGKQVSFSFVGGGGIIYQTDGLLSSIVFRLHGSPEFSLDDDDCNYFRFDEITDFNIL